MLARNFEDLKVWQESRLQVVWIYQHFGTGNKKVDFGFRDQIQRAAVSVMNNIAEGFERGTRKDFARFLDLAKGSAGEVRSMLSVAVELGYLSDDIATKQIEQSLGISRSLAALAKSLRLKEQQAKIQENQ